MERQKQNGNMVAIITMFFLFAMISFVTNLAAPIGVIWKNQFQDSSTLGMMGNLMNFLAYLFMGIPAGNMIVKIGYKKTALIAMAVGIVGLFVQYLSGVVGADTQAFSVGEMIVHFNFIIYLLGAFICGFCVCMLNTVVNPMLNTLGGGGNKGNQLIQVGGSLNSLAGTLTPIFVGSLIGTVTPQTAMSNVSSLLFIAMGIFVVAFLVISFVTVPEPHLHKAGTKKEKQPHSPWNFRHTVLGVVAICIYVGIEIGIPSTMNFYLADTTAKGGGLVENSAAIAGAMVGMYWLLMLVGRLTSSSISGKISSRTQLIAVASVAIFFVLLAIFMPKSVMVPMVGYSTDTGWLTANIPISALFLVLCGLCTSVMWGSIFNLAVEGLGKYTAQASGIFMMMVVGGGILPLAQQGISDAIGYMSSYWFIVVLLGYLLYYALVGCKNVNKDIPVE
ncbi:MAG: MFS transporter [Prevotellaceae bacterium]|jgi:FHS family L-fucose permease-like MFS transporter|nr:MFS transporter [Prevotellaceae bacterium]